MPCAPRLFSPSSSAVGAIGAVGASPWPVRGQFAIKRPRGGACRYEQHDADARRTKKRSALLPHPQTKNKIFSTKNTFISFIFRTRVHTHLPCPGAHNSPRALAVNGLESHLSLDVGNSCDTTSASVDMHPIHRHRSGRPTATATPQQRCRWKGVQNAHTVSAGTLLVAINTRDRSYRSRDEHSLVHVPSVSLMIMAYEVKHAQ